MRAMDRSLLEKIAADIEMMDDEQVNLVATSTMTTQYVIFTKSFSKNV